MFDPESPLIALAMRRACGEARLWLGTTAPNPPVGAAALSESGAILAVAPHRKAGTPHAEAALLHICRDQGLLPQLHAIAVTLEPCNHYGRTPPCSEAIIAAGVKHVVVGARDPNPHVQGGGIERLRQAGLTVTEGVEAEACRLLIHAFAFQARTGKPFVTVKRAFDAHGSMIPPAGQKTFTSPESLILAHRLRKKADAILTGSGTILADSPLFSVRRVPDHEGKRRILAILDRRGRIAPEYRQQAAARGLECILYQELDEAFADLARRGVQDVLVEAGPSVSEAVLASPHWTMAVDIYKGEQDRVETRFNPSADLPFDAAKFRWEDFLPA